MRRITPIGTILNDMKLIQYSSLVEQKSEIRISFLVQCLICGNQFKLINRYFLRSTRNKCPYNCKHKIGEKSCY